MAKSKKKIPSGISWRGRYSFSASLAAGTAAVNRKSGRMMAIGPKLSGLERGDMNEGTPPNAPFDHWPAACNRLDSLGFSAR
jgi:hypothetical protein